MQSPLQNITLITAIAGLVFGFLGAVLGIINTVRAINRDRVRLKIRPVWTFHADGHFISIEAVNIGYVAVTVEEVGFTLKSKEHSKLTFLPYGGTQLPHRLEPRTAVTIYAKPGLEYNAAFKDANPSNHVLSFKSVATSCLVIPVDLGQSNVVFNLNVENISEVKVDDLVVIVGFPDSWKIGVDPDKWEPVKEHFTSPDWKVELTNILSWGAHSPWPLFPTDSANFPPITNYNVSIFSDPATIRAGLLDITVRSTGFQKMMGANLIFLRGDSTFRKPFVTSMVEKGNGVWRFNITSNEIYELEQ